MCIGYCPCPVAVHTTGNIKGYIQQYYVILDIQLLLGGGSTQPIHSGALLLGLGSPCFRRRDAAGVLVGRGL